MIRLELYSTKWQVGTYADYDIMGTLEKETTGRDCSASLRDLSERKPLVEGHMFKQCRNRPNTFYKRYFILHENFLLYYPHEKNYIRDPTLQHCRVVNLKGLYLTRPTSYPVGVKHCFILHTPDPSNSRKEMMLVTSNRRAKNIWIELLQEQNPNLLPSARENVSKPSYISKIRMENAVHERLALTVSLPVSRSPTPSTEHQEEKCFTSVPNKSEIPGQLMRSDSFSSDSPTPPLCESQLSIAQFDKSQMTELETVSISSFSSDEIN